MICKSVYYISAQNAMILNSDIIPNTGKTLTELDCNSISINQKTSDLNGNFFYETTITTTVKTTQDIETGGFYFLKIGIDNTLKTIGQSDPFIPAVASISKTENSQTIEFFYKSINSVL